MSDPRDLPVYHCILHMISALVDDPLAINISETERSDAGVTFNITVAPSDVGKLLGKQGRTARSLRTLLGGMGKKIGRLYTLNIQEGSQTEAAG